VRNNGQGHQVQELGSRHSRACAQTVPAHALPLSTLSAVKGVVQRSSSRPRMRAGPSQAARALHFQAGDRHAA
jgi:hypothetical protein